MTNPPPPHQPCPACGSLDTEDAGWVRGRHVEECRDCGATFNDGKD